MARRIDLATLSPKQMLDLAVTVEEESRQRYRDLADQMRLHESGDAADFFDRLAELEGDHLDELRRLRTTRFGDAPETFGRSVPELDELEEEAPPYRRMRSMLTVHRALDVAIEAGRTTRGLFDAAAQQTDDDVLRALFDGIGTAKERHRRLIEEFRTSLPDAEPVDADADADVAGGPGEPRLEKGS